MYVTTQCDRCGKSFLTGEGAKLCKACHNRRQNGLRLAEERKEELAYERERLARMEREDYAFQAGIDIVDVPQFVGDDRWLRIVLGR